MMRFGLTLHAATNEAVTNYIASPPHAAILTGPIGIGKTLLAINLAAELLRVSVQKLENNPYYRQVRPVKQAITIEQVRSLIAFFRLQVPGQSLVKRVAVIEDADLLGIEAQNALLKLLEEPPVGSAMILTSSNPAGLLPTIRSRLQAIAITVPTTTDIVEHFTRQGYDLSSIEKAMLRFGGNIAAMAALLESGTAATDPSLDLVKQALAGTNYQRLLLVDSLAKQKEQAGTFVDTLASVAHASLRVAAQKGAASLNRWQAVLLASRTAQEALERNGNTKLVLTELMLAL